MLFSYLTKNWRIVATLCTLLGGIAAWYSITNHYENKGYNRAVEELQREAAAKIAEATGKAVKEAQVEFQKALTNQQEVFDVELQRAKNERIVQTEIQEVIKNVDKIKIKNECSNLDDSAIRVLNDSINTANRTEG